MELFVRLTARVESFDILTWISCQPDTPKCYWMSRDGKFESAAIGTTLKIATNDEQLLNETISTLSSSTDKKTRSIRLFGGLPFDKTRATNCDAEWIAFDGGFFFMPLFELSRKDDTYELACNLSKENLSDEKFTEVCNRLENIVLCEVSNVVSEPMIISSRVDYPDRSAWTNSINSTLEKFESGGSDKIVLARKSDLMFDTDVSAWGLVRRLKENSFDCTIFCLEPENGICFAGASPERLYSRLGKQVFSEAVAGTTGRSSNDNEDAQLAEQLLNSKKDLLEHSFVVDAVEESLRSLCSDVRIVSRLKVRKLARVQHLAAEFEAELSGAVADLEIIQTLHPTPAVNGSPTEMARKEINMLEPFDRGWYAGPIGWISADEAQIAVAIRSGLIEGKKVSLYSGAGIVRGSEAESEWNEIENKISNFLRAMTGS